MAKSINETEIKYEMPNGVALPKLDELSSIASVRAAADEDLDAQYFDTDDLRLIHAGVTLRRRVGGHDEGWHLKTPVGLHTRREIHSPLGRQTLRDGDLTVPDELMELVLVHTRGKRVRPAAVIKTQRRRLLLLDESGDQLAELAIDDVHAQVRGDPSPRAWREVELELTGGDEALLQAADKFLLDGGLVRSDQSAKFARAMGLGPQDRLPLGPGGPSASAGDVVTAYLAEQVAAMKALDPAVRGDEPDAVHQMRIAVRRLRSTLRTFSALWQPQDGQATDQVSTDLKWLGTQLGRPRDAEVLQGHLRAATEALPGELVLGPVQARIQGHYARVSADAREKLAKALRSRRYFSLLDRLDAMVTEPALTAVAARPAKAVLRAAVRRSYRQTRRRMDRAAQAPAGRKQEAALHSARRAAKRTRFAAEAVTPVFGRPAERFARRLQRVQSTLGDHQDSVIARQAERELAIAAAQNTENAFSYGVLYQSDADAGLRAIARGQRAWVKASRRKFRAWLKG
ncbi:MAG TPA: CYTH and CHAD domain-containing protein [Streptosporangiaceae bacterium]|nr:CYTH and CHAD domain-containing protein [Streptosporangiaceae bacterium]